MPSPLPRIRAHASLVAAALLVGCHYANPWYHESAGEAASGTTDGGTTTTTTTTSTTTTTNSSGESTGTTTGVLTTTSDTTSDTTTSDTTTGDPGGPGLACGEGRATDEILWWRRIGGAGVQRASEVAVAADGGVYVVGRFTSTVSLGPFAASSSEVDLEVFVAHLAADGEPLWLRTFGGVGDDFASAIAVDSAGEVVIVGRFVGELALGGPPYVSAGKDDAFIARLDPAGEVLWSRAFGGEADDRLHDVVIDEAGDAIASGDVGALALPVELSPQVLLTGDATSALVIRFDAGGEATWARQGSSGDAKGTSTATNLVLGKPGILYVAGTYNFNLQFGGKQIAPKGTGGDPWLAQLDDVDAKWLVGFGGDEAQTGRNVAFDATLDRVIATVLFVGDPGVKGLTPADLTTDAGIFSAKAGDGVPQWAVQVTGMGDVVTEGVVVDELGRIRWVGDFGGGAKVADLSFEGMGKDFLVLLLDGEGLILGVRHFTGLGEQGVEGVAVTPGACAAVVGGFGGDLMSGGSTLLTKAPDVDGFVMLLPP